MSRLHLLISGLEGLESSSEVIVSDGYFHASGEDVISFSFNTNLYDEDFIKKLEENLFKVNFISSPKIRKVFHSCKYQAAIGNPHMYEWDYFQYKGVIINTFVEIRTNENKWSFAICT